MDQRAQAGRDREIRTRRADEPLQAEQATLLEHRDSDLARSRYRVPKLFEPDRGERAKARSQPRRRPSALRARAIRN